MNSPALRLDIRTRRTLLPDCSEEEVSFVSCPLTCGSRPLETCKRCERAEGVLHDSAGHWFVICRVRAAEPIADLFAGADPSWQSSTVAEAMSTKPFCVRGDVELAEVAARLRADGIGGAPVVDDAGRPIGIVSKADLRAEEMGKRPGNRQVRDVMKKGAPSVSDRAPLVDAIRLMADQGAQRVVVVDVEGLLVGVLSTLDVLNTLEARMASQALPEAESE
jgi:CBS-domain-containing membrane protein